MRECHERKSRPAGVIEAADRQMLSFVVYASAAPGLFPRETSNCFGGVAKEANARNLALASVTVNVSRLKRVPDPNFGQNVVRLSGLTISRQSILDTEQFRRGDVFVDSRRWRR